MRDKAGTGEITSYADVVIAGGGASGLAAAIELGMSSPGLNVVILEKNSEPGRKIRATGSGRCNITNRDAEGYTEIMKFFARIGLVTRTYDNGLVYPYSESAADAAQLLESRARDLGTEIMTGAEVTSVAACADSKVFPGSGLTRTQRYETEYEVRSTEGVRRHRIRSAYVILACGGKAGPMFGTTGDGYRLARNLGHSIVTPVPVLTSVECSEWAADHRPAGMSLAGTRSRGTVTLYKRDADTDKGSREIFRETGEIQFTKYGLSGICVFNLTRHMRYDRSAGESINDFTIVTDLFPDGDITVFLKERRKHAFDGEKVRDILRTVLKENIAAYVIEYAGINASCRHIGDKNTSMLTDSDIEALSRAVHSLTFHPEKLRGWKEAQATSGGVSLSEIDPETCESLISEGLYITGELADRDFMCGGFNLSNAWITGMKAARAVSGRAD